MDDLARDRGGSRPRRRDWAAIGRVSFASIPSRTDLRRIRAGSSRVAPRSGFIFGRLEFRRLLHGRRKCPAHVRRCLRCGRERAGGSREEQCAGCLLKVAVLGPDVTTEETVGEESAWRHRFEPYTTISLLGQGGMGVVYLAKQENPIGRTAALKVLKPAMCAPNVHAPSAAHLIRSDSAAAARLATDRSTCDPLKPAQFSEDCAGSRSDIAAPIRSGPRIKARRLRKHQTSRVTRNANMRPSISIVRT